MDKVKVVGRMRFVNFCGVGSLAGGVGSNNVAILWYCNHLKYCNKYCVLI